MKMIPKAQENEIKLRYVQNPNDLSYDVLRRQVEYWLESLADTGPIPMDLSLLNKKHAKMMTETELEEALSVLRAKSGGRGPKGEGKKAIKGKCWVCEKPGHMAADCPDKDKTTPKGKGKQKGKGRNKGNGRSARSLESGEETDEEESDSSDDEEGTGISGLE